MSQPQEEPTLDEETKAAMEEEQKYLDQAVMNAQLQHLMNRAVYLNAEARRLAKDNPPD